MEDLQFKPRLHVFVCVNDRNGKSSCGPKITLQEFMNVKSWIQDNGLSGSVYCTRTGCLGFCNSEGGVVAIYPKGRFVKGIQKGKEIIGLINEELHYLKVSENF